MRIAILTSSRADFGIYLPLLKKLKEDPFFDLKIIAFGTHLSPFHGFTIDQIIKEGFEANYKIESLVLSDSQDAISSAMGLTMIKFSSFWKEHHKQFDLVFCLGDRYEMFAAVLSALPFHVKFAHLHGGEKTLGAIDNVFRHSISLASSIHFTSTEEYKNRIYTLLDEPNNVYNVGALSLDNILQIPLLDNKEFEQKWGINLNQPTTGLITFHPETVNSDKNAFYAQEIINSIYSNPALQFLITMPNADTAGNVIRNLFIKQLTNNKKVFLIENLGTQSYFSAIKNCSFLLGNTSSGIIEAASFGKYVINLGDRQKGRLCGKNVIHIPILENEINLSIQKIVNQPPFVEENIYYNGGASNKIVATLKALNINEE